MAKLSETTKSRIWLYGLVIGGIALCSLLVNGWNLHYIRQYGVVLMPNRTIQEAADAQTAMDLAVLAAQGDERAVFDEKTIEEALLSGQTVIACTTPRSEDAAYVRVTGASEDGGFLLRDATGAQVTGVRFYRIYLLP